MRPLYHANLASEQSDYRVKEFEKRRWDVRRGMIDVWRRVDVYISFGLLVLQNDFGRQSQSEFVHMLQKRCNFPNRRTTMQ